MMSTSRLESGSLILKLSNCESFGITVDPRGDRDVSALLLTLQAGLAYGSDQQT